MLNSFAYKMFYIFLSSTFLLFDYLFTPWSEVGLFDMTAHDVDAIEWDMSDTQRTICIVAQVPPNSILLQFVQSASAHSARPRF